MTLRDNFAATTTPTTNGNRLTFVANSGKPMVNGQTVDIHTLRIPVNDGDYKLVTDLTDTDRINVPLLLDHQHDAEYQLGRVTRLWLDDRGMWCEATLADVPRANIVKELAKADALSNSFSISVEHMGADKTNTIHNGSLLEISVVYRGMDDKAIYKSINHRKDNAMDITKLLRDKIAQYKLDQTEADELLKAITDVLNDALGDIIETVNKQTDPNTKDEPDKTDPTNGDPQTPEPPAQSTNNRTIIINNTRSNVPGIATVTQPHTWMDSPDALAEYERTMLRADGMSVDLARDQWMQTARKHMGSNYGIDQPSVKQLVPTAIADTIQDALNEAGCGLWKAYKKTGLDRRTFTKNAEGTLSDTNRAHGYRPSDYGTQKKEQTIKLLSIVAEPDYVYKYISLNKGDLRRTKTPGVLAKYVAQELVNKVIQTIERQTVFGGYTDMGMFEGALTASKDATANTWKGADRVRTVKHPSKSNLLLDVRNTVLATRGTKADKVLVLNSDTLRDLMIATDAIGNTLIPLGDEAIANYLGVREIMQPEWWEETDDTQMLAACINTNNYELVGDTTVESFTNFALRTNTNEMLAEIFQGGAFAADKSATVLVPGE